MSRPSPIRVLFVCLGNICRSPTGEAVFRHLVEERGLGEHYEIDSAGTSAYHIGEPADERMTRAAAARGIHLTSRGRQATSADFTDFDVIVAMDRANERNLLALCRSDAEREKVVRMMALHPNPPTPDVPDPYYGGPQGFEEVLDLVTAACERLLEQLEAGRREGAAS